MVIIILYMLGNFLLTNVLLKTSSPRTNKPLKSIKFVNFTRVNRLHPTLTYVHFFTRR